MTDTHTNESPSVNECMKVQEIRELLLGAATALDSQWSACATAKLRKIADDFYYDADLVPTVNTRAAEILDDLKISEFWRVQPASKLFDGLVERIDEPSPGGSEEPEMKAILGEIAERLGKCEEEHQRILTLDKEAQR